MSEQILPTLPERFEAVPLSHLVESKSNPRTAFDPNYINELAGSIRSNGIIQPIVTRPNPDKKTSAKKPYEIVAGACRFRAAQIAYKAEPVRPVPTIIREYSDDQVLEIQLIENLQRQGVHPLQEADGFKRLLELPGYTVEVIAEKIGQKPEYISKRIQLGRLIQLARAAFYEDKINIGHATLLARLSPADQEIVYKEYLFEDGTQRFVKGRGWVCDDDGHAIRVADLDRTIKDKIFLNLSAAPWKKDDAELVPAAGPCITCPKHTGSNALLFDDMAKNDCCLDRACFEAKRAAFIIKVQDVAKAKGEPLVRVISTHVGQEDAKKLQALSRHDYHEVSTDADKKRAKGMKLEQAIVVDGANAGRTITITRDPKFSGGHSSSSSNGKKKDFWAERAASLDKRIVWYSRKAVLTAILAKPLKWDVPHDQLQVVGLALLGNSVSADLVDCLKLPHMTGEMVRQKNGYDISGEIEKMIRAPKGSPASDLLPKVVLGLALADAAKEYSWKDSAEVKRLETAAKALKVDAAKIGKELRAEMRADFDSRRKKAGERKAEQEAREKAKGKVKKAKGAK